MMNPDALSGIRVVDLGMITAGAATSQVLADFGADVIKVESPTRPDPFRNWNQIARDADDDPDNSPPFHAVNRNKRGIGLDLKNPAARKVFLDLVAKSDIVVENFRRGVMEGLGLSFDELRLVNPLIVLLSLGSQGESGPESRYVSFGSTLEAVGGSMSITGYDSAHPVWTGNNVNFPDQLVSIAAPGAVLAALIARDRTGEGVHVDFSQRESVTSVLGEALVEYQLTGEVPAPRGNDARGVFLQGVYAAEGVDSWLALTLHDAEQWKDAAQILDIPDDQVAELATGRARWRHHAVADAVVNRNASELAVRLQRGRIAASQVMSAKELLEDEQLESLDFFVVAPGRSEKQRGYFARLSDTPGKAVRAAPSLGEHTVEVLSGLLGYSREEIDRLLEDGGVHASRAAVEAAAI